MERTVEFNSMKFIVHFLFFMWNIAGCLSQSSQEDAVKFQVKPGTSEQQYTHSWADTECSFLYTCMGGTGESWEMKISKSGDDMSYTCSVKRPSSYLHFQHFALSYTSTNQLPIRDVQVQAGGKLITADQYNIDSSTYTVSSTNAFKHSLDGITIVLMNGNHQPEIVPQSEDVKTLQEKQRKQKNAEDKIQQKKQKVEKEMQEKVKKEEKQKKKKSPKQKKEKKEPESPVKEDL